MAKVIGGFSYGFLIIEEEGEVKIDPHLRIENVPEELVLMKMRAQLKKMEKDYFYTDNKNF